ncbi:MAG: methyltransferase domain-containing protein [Bacteroidota bacterium]|nr:methyltransferase domain-containing protein [Bacteroidota bacterium]MDP4234536.1 methyltransferase domain-containing protein [Bacteroidota bacterium]MDP4242601.1 methyltransferase domain-containing protein [Bacteroidota bacterium]MDP4289177.1 methyltransferase domain-containing protein [Bacteroidota bacterium]
MHTSSLVGHTTEVFAKFRKNPLVPADAVIRAFFHDRRYLGARDRRFIADHFFGAVKHWLRLDALVRDCFEDKELTASKSVAAYLIAIDGHPAQEVVDFFDALKDGEKLSLPDAEALADRARENTRLAALTDDERLATLHSFPTWFVTRLRAEYGNDTEPILTALNGSSPLWLRTNTLITDRESLISEMEEEGIPSERSDIASEALKLEKRVNVFGLKSFTRGAFEVQDEASQLVVPMAHIRKTAIKALDACAGAGGKTLHLAALMKNHGEIFAADIDPYKLEELKRRSRRAGAQNIRLVFPDDREKWLGPEKLGWFDLVLVDAPCTGTGTLRRNPGIKWLLTEQMLSELVAKQRSILDDHAAFVKLGGALVFATCSVLQEEGEQQMEWFTQQHPEFQIEEVLRTRPDTQNMDGFFAARLRKNPV